MDQIKTGGLLARLRRERAMTQKEVADVLHISDRTVSKWERGMGMPDVSMWKGISALYGVDIEKLLEGELSEKETEAGNMKRMKFYRCAHCGNIFWSTGGGEISCCGRRLAPMVAQEMDDAHDVKIEEIDGEHYVTFAHPMTKEHAIAFAAFVSWDRATVVRLYPEQAGEVRFPRIRWGKLYICCNRDGLFYKKL